MKIAITGASTLAAEALSLYNNIPQGRLSDRDQKLIEQLRASNSAYEPLDPTVLYALHTARRAVAQAGWQGVRFGINIGSSRGATMLFEQHFSHFLKEGSCQTLASPTTTLGNISTWVAQDLSNEVLSSHILLLALPLYTALPMPLRGSKVVWKTASW